LAKSADGLVPDISVRLREAGAWEIAEKPSRKLEEMPPENSPEAKNFRSPVPYKRIKPEYTPVAYLYGVAATVDILLDLDEQGKILRTEIVRWAGYGLDEAVTDAVRKMNWRPAERAGKPLPLRVLLRYNFKKVEKEEQ
jgi:TonB family protein